MIFSHTARTPLAIRAFAMAVFAMAITGRAAELPEILVTAQLRESTLLETSSSISVVTSAEIRQRSAQHLEQLLNATPNVNLAGGSSRARFFQIRGVGERGQFQEPLNPSVGVLLDGVDFSGIGTIGTLFDVAQVEVLRGPQGTLHGANALAGLINIRSEEPTDSPYHRIEGTAGDYDSYGLGFVSSGPLSDQLRYRVAAWRSRLRPAVARVECEHTIDDGPAVDAALCIAPVAHGHVTGSNCLLPTEKIGLFRYDHCLLDHFHQFA